jgi:hypothetical protein
LQCNQKYKELQFQNLLHSPSKLIHCVLCFVLSLIDQKMQKLNHGVFHQSNPLSVRRFVLGSEERPVLDKCNDNGENDVAATATAEGGNEGMERSNGNNSSSRRPIGTPPEPPYYMTVRVDRRKKRKRRKFFK